MPDVLICEMSPRDGLQFLGAASGPEPRLVPLDMKLELVRRLVAAGLGFIEVGSFVSDRVSQMRDTDALCAGVPRAKGVQFAALVPNLKHYARFQSSGLDTVALFVSASEPYSRKNVGASLDEALDSASEVGRAARADGKRLRAHVSGAFQELYADDTPSDLEAVVRVTRRLIDMGCEHVSLADTDGAANPRRVAEVLTAVGAAVGVGRLAVHLHDRYGQALANALAAHQSGVRIFDASVGGVGGTPAARSAGHNTMAGNVATEDLVCMFEKMGVSTGVNLDALIEAGRLVYDITQHTGDGAPPGRTLRERLGYDLAWRRADARD